MTCITVSERLAACALVRKRFAGRAALEDRASGSWRQRGRRYGGFPNLVALAQLEHRLGLVAELDVLTAQREQATQDLIRLASQTTLGEPSWPQALGALLAGEDYVTREAQARREYALGRCVTVARAAAPWICSEIDSLRLLRAARASIIDFLATREPGHAARVVAVRRAQEQRARCHFRKASHGHSQMTLSVARGHEGASSSSERVSSSSAGMSNAYCRQAFSVAQSSHTWHVSPAILDPEVRALNESTTDAVYLTYDLRVVQGRGTSLTVQRRGPKGGWK